MTSDWKECKVENLGDIKTGKTPKTSIQENYGGDIPFLTPSDDMSVKYVRNTTKKITELGLNEVKNCLLPANSICVSCIGSDLGKVVITTEPTIANQQINSIIVNTDKYDVDFCYYLMVQLGKLLNYHSKTSTAVPIVNKSSFSNYEVLVPPLEIQRKIARVLGAIDDKIELNNSINKNLEQQAQAIFKSWFIDFEPFGGTMPDDWNMGTIADLGQVIGGGTPSKNNKEYYTNNGIAWITPKDLSKNKNKFISNGDIDITDIGYKNSSTVLMPRGTVLFSSRAPIGYIAIAKNNVTTNQGFKSVIPKKEIGTAYVYYYLKQNTDKIENMASGSTFKEVSGSILKSVSAIVPNYNILTEFELFCNPIFKQQEYLEFENERLTQLRDTLLPKLMNGEIDVDKVEV